MLNSLSSRRFVGRPACGFSDVLSRDPAIQASADHRGLALGIGLVTALGWLHLVKVYGDIAAAAEAHE
jgi:hypothetical protein